MRDYLNLLKARYTTVMRQSLRAASNELAQDRPVADPNALRQARAGVLDDDAPALIEEIALPDGTRSSSPDLIRDGCTRHVARLFTSGVDREGDPTFLKALSDFVQGIPTLSDDMTSTSPRQQRGMSSAHV